MFIPWFEHVVTITRGDYSMVSKGMAQGLGLIDRSSSMRYCVSSAGRHEVNVGIACSRVYRPLPRWAYIACGEWEFGLFSGQVGTKAPYV